MARDTKLYVEKCDECKAIKAPTQILRPLMGDQVLTVRPLQRLYCDFLGPYPLSKAKNTSLFIAIDHFTKFLFLQPMKKASSINVIDFLKNSVFNTFGTPQYLHTDNGKQFLSKEMAEFLELYGVTHVRTGLYSPQANASERANREIVSKIRFFLKDEAHHMNWDTCIPHVLSVLRSDYHTAIDCPPYYAMFGQNMCTHGSAYKLLDKLGMLTDDTLVKRTDKLASIREKIMRNLAKAHEKSAKTYNTRAKQINYREGQEIFRKNHSQSKFSKAVNAKFNSKFIKCRIRKRIGNALYEIEDLNGKLIGTYHASDLKP